MTKSCPCHECICIPVCKHKVYQKLVDCRLVRNFLYHKILDNTKDEYQNRLGKVIKELGLKPVYVYVDGGKVHNNHRVISQKGTFGEG